MLPERKKEMIETQKRIQKEFSLLLRDTQLHPILVEQLLPLVKKRISHIGIRSFFVSTIYKYVCENAKQEKIKLKEYNNQEHLFTTQLPLVAEIIIAIQYYENQILDGKGGLPKIGEATSDKVHKNLIASHYLKDLLYDYIDTKIFPDDCIKGRIVLRAVRRIFQCVDLGQAFQDEWGTIEDFNSCDNGLIFIEKNVNLFIEDKIIKEYMEEIDSKIFNSNQICFVETYFRRISLTSGALYGLLSNLIIDLLEYDGKEKGHIFYFSVHYGMIAQVINDNNDFLHHDGSKSTVEKISSDGLSDIKNNVVTLPLSFYFADNPSDSNETIFSNLINRDIITEMSVSIAINKSLNVINNMCVKSYAYLNKYNFHSILLKDIFSICKIESYFFKKYSLTNEVILKHENIKPSLENKNAILVTS